MPTNLVTHPVYGVRAELPADWIAEQAHSDLYPADTWWLHPATANTPAVTLILGWLPRGGRHSASFPGGLTEDARADTRTIGGVARAGTAEKGDRSFKVDFDAGELAVSIRGYALDDATRVTVDAVMAQLAFDDDARPADFPSPARRALDLARAWARERGLPTERIVTTGAPAGASYVALTVFHPRGLHALRVDPASGAITESR
nr:hypothetical protein [Kofleriaceae bacterium]